MSAVEDRLAAIIAEQMRTDGWTCEYHEPTSREGECGGCDESLTRTARAAAAVIASSADLAVIELPKPTPGDHPSVWFGGWEVRHGMVWSPGRAGAADYMPMRLRVEAAEMLAAARAAEAVDRG